MTGADKVHGRIIKAMNAGKMPVGVVLTGLTMAIESSFQGIAKQAPELVGPTLEAMRWMLDNIEEELMP